MYDKSDLMLQDLQMLQPSLSIEEIFKYNSHFW